MTKWSRKSFVSDVWCFIIIISSREIVWYFIVYILSLRDSTPSAQTAFIYIFIYLFIFIYLQKYSYFVFDCFFSMRLIISRSYV